MHSKKKKMPTTYSLTEILLKLQKIINSLHDKSLSSFFFIF